MTVKLKAWKVTLGLIWLLTISFAYAEPQRIVFQSTDTPPYWTPSLPDGGLGGSLLKLLSTNAGIDYSINFLPTKRFRETNAPFIVGDPDLLLNQQSLTIFPIGIFETAFFYYKPHHNALELGSFKNLQGLTLGVLQGTLEDRDYFTHHGVKIEEANSTDSLLRMMKKGRIDVCILVAGTGRYTIKKIFPDEQDAFTLSVIPKLTRPLAIMIHVTDPSTKAIADRYHQILENTLHSKSYQTLIETYGQSLDINSGTNQYLDRFLKQYANTWN